MGLKPEIKAYLTERASLGLPQVWQAPLDEIRENNKLNVALQQPLVAIELVEQRRISGPTSVLPIGFIDLLATQIYLQWYFSTVVAGF